MENHASFVKAKNTFYPSLLESIKKLTKVGYLNKKIIETVGFFAIFTDNAIDNTLGFDKFVKYLTLPDECIGALKHMESINKFLCIEFHGSLDHFQDDVGVVFGEVGRIVVLTWRIMVAINHAKFSCMSEERKTILLKESEENETTIMHDIEFFDPIKILKTMYPDMTDKIDENEVELRQACDMFFGHFTLLLNHAPILLEGYKYLYAKKKKEEQETKKELEKMYKNLRKDWEDLNDTMDFISRNQCGPTPEEEEFFVQCKQIERLIEDADDPMLSYSDRFKILDKIEKAIDEEIKKSKERKEKEEEKEEKEEDKTEE